MECTTDSLISKLIFFNVSNQFHFFLQWNAFKILRITDCFGFWIPSFLGSNIQVSMRSRCDLYLTTSVPLVLWTLMISSYEFPIGISLCAAASQKYERYTTTELPTPGLFKNGDLLPVNKLAPFFCSWYFRTQKKDCNAVWSKNTPTFTIFFEIQLLIRTDGSPKPGDCRLIQEGWQLCNKPINEMSESAKNGESQKTNSAWSIC